MAVSAIARVTVYSAQHEDVNGDAAVNVLDVQRLFSEVMARGVDAGSGDVNRDGVVDVLDLQRMLAQAVTPDDTGEDLPADANGDAVPVAPAKITPLLVATAVDRLLVQVSSTSGSDRLAPLDEDERVIPSQTVRYLYRLTPHAPPLFV